MADFGIARIIGPSLRITHSGMLFSTPEYMAPEQSDGRAVDHRTDVYALGMILIEILTGRLPYLGETPMSVILQHIQEPVRLPRDINPDSRPPGMRLSSSVWRRIPTSAIRAPGR